MLPPVKAPKLPAAKALDSTDKLVRVPVGDLHVLKGLNVRVDLPRLDELIASIQANGFYDDKPLAGYASEDGVIVIDGHRRLAAVQKINDDSLDGPVIADLPVVVKPETASLADIHIAQVQSATGEPLTMFEKGIAVRRIMTDGMSKEDVAKAFGVTTKTIDNYIAVASAPAKARDLLLDGKVRETHVLRALSKPDPAAALQAMVDKAKSSGRAVARQGDAGPAKVKAPDAPTPAPTPQDDDKTVTVEIVREAAMGPVLKAVAAAIRERVPHDSGEDDFAFVNGTVTVTVNLAIEPKPLRSRKKEPVPAELSHAIPADEEL